MKLNKRILKEMIYEALNEANVDRTALVKQMRADPEGTKTARAAAAARLTGPDIEAKGIIQELDAILNAQGIQADKRTVDLLNRIKEFMQAKVKGDGTETETERVPTTPPGMRERRRRRNKRTLKRRKNR